MFQPLVQRSSQLDSVKLVRNMFATSNVTVVLKKTWNTISGCLGSCLITLIVFAFGITARGEWVVLVAHLMRQFGILQEPASTGQDAQQFSWENISLESLHLKGLLMMWTLSHAVGYTVYFVTGGILHWYFYVKLQDKPEIWKCQPLKWLSYELQMDAIKYGCRSLLIAGSVSAVLACYIVNGGWSMVYYRVDQYSWLWYFTQWPVLFCFQDYSTYLLHRFFHTPWMYKMVHKVHHKYVQPTAFTVTALHPVEILSVQFVSCIPLFTIPLHWSSFTTIALYIYYNGIIDHSGVDFKAPWWQPWRPDTMFHDNHHQYFHVNFGFNCYIWDKLHGTFRRSDRIYKENIYYGRGKPLSEASAEEIDKEIKERLTENPKAHRLMNPFLTEEEILKLRKQR